MEEQNTYTVARQEHVSAPPAAIRERLVDFHRWESWSPWEDLDPNMRKAYKGADAGVGAIYEWDGNRKAGKGRMEMVDVDDSSVTIDLRFEKPFKSQSTTAFTLEPEGDGTRVTWSLTGPKTFTTRVMGLFTSMDKMVGPDFEKGLARLKTEVEAADHEAPSA